MMHNFPTKRAVLTGIIACGTSIATAKAQTLFAVSPEDKLATLARRKGIFLGSAIDETDLDVPGLSELYLAHCTSLTPRNSLKWTGTEKRRDVFSFSDRVPAFATANGLKTYGHTLVWYQLPTWVKAISDADDLRLAMTNHISRVMNHYRGDVFAWDVINEPMEYDIPQMRSMPFYNILGEDYIRTAFEAARTADARALLVMNECHLEKTGQAYNERRALFLKLVTRLLRTNTPIDAIGIQGHFRPGLDTLDEKQFALFCKEINSLGLSIVITELDASCKFSYRQANLTDQDYADVFESAIRVATENGKLLGVTLWGLAEKYAATEPGTALGAKCQKRINLYDETNNPRPTLAGIRRALSSMPDKMAL